MSKSRREIQEQLQKDEVAETFQHWIEDFRKHRTLIIIIAITALIGALIILGLRSHRETVQADINDKVSAAINNYSTIVAAQDPEQRKSGLDATLNAADTLANAYSGDTVGREALFIKGKAWFLNGNAATSITETQRSYDEARKAYQAYLERAQNDDEKARGEIALGYTAENEAFFQPREKQAGKINEAMSHYVNAANLAAGPDKNNPRDAYLYYYALLGQARLLELQPGQEAKAIELYKQILNQRPAPVEVARNDESAAAEDNMAQMLRRQIEEGESQMSFQATARLRLDRLQATQAGPAAVTAQAQAAGTPVPAASPVSTTAAKPEATPAAKPAATTTTTTTKP